MPEEEYSKHYTFLKEKDWLTFDEITRLAKIFVKLGVKKVRLTGGEPLLRPNLNLLIKELNKIAGIEDLALTTNGSLLARQAANLKEAGLRRLTVSLDTVDSRVFKTMSGGKGNLAQILEGIKEAQRVGFQSIKINIVIQKGVNDHTILGMVDYFKNSGHVLRFIEYMDVGNCNHWESGYVVPSNEIIERIQRHYPLKFKKADYFGEVSKRYEFVDGSGEIGFIASVSQPFCRACTRARLSTDGKIYTCLFAEDGKDIRRALREGASDKQLEETIKGIWKEREDRYSELRAQNPPSHRETHKVEMFQIGG